MGEETHFDQREDTVALLPLGQATVSGFPIMPPPQAKPAQPMETGAVIWRRVSKGAEPASGTAMRKVGFEALLEYDR